MYAIFPQNVKCPSGQFCDVNPINCVTEPCADFQAQCLGMTIQAGAVTRLFATGVEASMM